MRYQLGFNWALGDVLAGSYSPILLLGYNFNSLGTAIIKLCTAAKADGAGRGKKKLASKPAEGERERESKVGRRYRKAYQAVLRVCISTLKKMLLCLFRKPNI